MFKLSSIDPQALAALANGGVVVLPTDTVYGLAARALDQRGVDRLYALKSRDKKPGTIIASDIGQLAGLGISDKYLNVAKEYWPGPVSVIIPANDKLTYLHQGLGSLAFRVVADRELSELLAMTGPLVTSSANDPGQPTANNIDEARKYFGDKVDWYIDGGSLSGRKASRIIRIDGQTVTVIRD